MKRCNDCLEEVDYLPDDYLCENCLNEMEELKQQHGMELIENISTDKYQRLTYKYKTQEQLEYHRIGMNNDGWNIDQWDEEGLIMSYCKTLK